MASAEVNIVRQLEQHTQCSICIDTLTDPRILPCLHTFCLKCLENTASRCEETKRPDDEMPCPYCRTVFTIPLTGFAGLKRDFKTDSLISIANKANLKLTMTSICDSHKTKSLDAYCLQCEKPVCCICLIENHQGHKATDIVKVRERFSQELAEYMKRISSYKQQSLHLSEELDEKKTRYLKETLEKENVILKRRKELIYRIERNTSTLLDELSSLKAQHLAKMEKEREELEKQCAIMDSYETYYEATVAKASLVDLCHAKEELPIMIEKLDEWFNTSKLSSFEVLIQLHDKIVIDLKNEINNIVGRIKTTTKDVSRPSTIKVKKVIVVGSGDSCGESLTNEMFEFNLIRKNEISKLQPVPTKMQPWSVAVSLDDKLYAIGIGNYCNEIWKFERISGWKKCADLKKGRWGHCVNIVDTLIYICSGWNQFSGKFLKSVEVFDIQTNKCSIVGELKHAVKYSASVAYKGLIYIFGGRLEDGTETDYIQIYNPAVNRCSVFPKPMPSPQTQLRALQRNNSVILLNAETCFVFNFEKRIWREMKQFKTDVVEFGLVRDEEKVYVFGGRDKSSKKRDEIKSVLLDDIIKGNIVEWRLHGRLPKPTGIYAYA